uniref:Uncharacterized protein n=1 Tax=Leersia perrieri TaxID=77586 RepID=A0A0D9XLM2_9ORYZ
MPIAFNSAGYAGIGILDLDGKVPTINPLEIAGDDGLESDASSGSGNNYAGLEDEDHPSKRIIESHLVECNGELLHVVMHDENGESKATAAAAIAIGGRNSRNKSDERWVDVY